MTDSRDEREEVLKKGKVIEEYYGNKLIETDDGYYLVNGAFMASAEKIDDKGNTNGKFLLTDCSYGGSGKTFFICKADAKPLSVFLDKFKEKLPYNDY